MGLFSGAKNEIRREFIARPDEAKDFVVWKWTDSNIRMFSQLTVEADENAVFFRDGTARGLLKAGRHTLDSSNIPFLGLLVDAASGGNMFISEIFFVTTREMPNQKFGGPIGDMRDPDTKLAIGLMVYGDFSFRVVDPEKLIVGLAGMGKADNDSFTQWFKQQMLKTIRDASAELVVKKRWPLLDVTSGAYTEEIEQEAVQKVKAHMGTYGVDVVRMGNFVVSMKEEDEATLKKFSERQALTGLAGDPNYQRAAQAEPMFGLGKGLANPGSGGGTDTALSGAALGMGFGMAQQMMGAGGQQAQAQAATIACPACGKQVKAAKFCSECGAKMLAVPACPKCNADVAPGTKFCAACGAPLSAPAVPKCPKCGKELATGVKFCPDDGAKIG
jgi:membrane protease subunit (stomatin/prohibitin family)